MIPKYYTISIHKSGKFDIEDLDHLRGFKYEEMINELEKDIRDNIWRYILENDIKITIE